MNSRFSLALIVNPVAGIGGPAALKGSDQCDSVDIAQKIGVQSATPRRVDELVQGLLALLGNQNLLTELTVYTCSGEMGESYLAPLKAHHNDSSIVIETCFCYDGKSRAEDTQQAARVLSEKRPDLLVFVGGDGTARDICAGVRQGQLVLGLPAGVKMHSGVFAVTPKAVVSVIQSLLEHKLVAARLAEVRDIDEEAFQQGRVNAKYYGEMLIPDDQLLVQSVKCSGMLDDELMLDDLSDYIAETLVPDTLYVLGSGGTLQHIKRRLEVTSPTLLGIDAVYVDPDGYIREVGFDLHELAVYEIVSEYPRCKIILSVIGGQGVVLGRGNQQISPRVLERVGIENLHFVSTQNKLLALEGKALKVDSGSDDINRALAGFHPILCGYEDSVLYEIAYT